MAKKSSRRLSEHERAERRRQDRERLQRAAQELLSSEGWARWVWVRAMFHSYSAGNCMLIALQCHERGMVPERVAGFRTWLRLGRAVRKNEKALRILAPVTVKERDEGGEETGERRVFFKTAFVFALSQTEPLPRVEPVLLEPPREPLTGDSHAHLIEPMQAFAESLGFTVAFESIDGSAGGWCDARNRRIVVDVDAPANARLRTLIHECAHALGIDYRSHSRAQAEVMVETVTLLAASTVGLAVDGETIPYVSGWGEDGALEAVTEFAETIDTIARRIEDVLLAATEPEPAQAAA
ncbi:MAG TPA: ArdC family protein [Solirubrobacteraceae bacterium]|nr:ArdC family protein [Solirubrobacteraceae bacterium]